MYIATNKQNHQHTFSNDISSTKYDDNSITHETHYRWTNKYVGPFFNTLENKFEAWFL